MKKNKKITFVFLITLAIAISALSTIIDTFSKSDTQDDTGGWLSTSELAPGQTWPDFWQARIDNPYASERAKSYARWIISNGYSNYNADQLRAMGVWQQMESELSGTTQSSNNSNTQSSNTNTATTNNTSSKPESPTSTIRNTLTEGDYGIYVVTSKKAIYSAYTSDKKEIGSLSKGTEVEVTGNTSNGYYQFTYTNEDGETVDAYLLYKNKDNIVDKETYDAAWSETSNVAATCTNDGYIEYTNSLSGLTRREEIKASGHVLGDEELTKEPGLFTKGEIVTHCAVCGEIIETRALDSYLPIWSLGVVAILIIGIVSAIIIKKKKINK